MKEAIEQLITNDMAIVSATVDSTTLLIRSLVKAGVLTKEQAASVLSEASDHIKKMSEDPKRPGQETVLKIISDHYKQHATDMSA